MKEKTKKVLYWILCFAAVAIALGITLPKFIFKSKPSPMETEGSVDNLHMDGNTIVYGNYRYKMIYVSGGTYIMGCTSEQGDDCNEEEKPAHSVTVSDFYIGQTEVPNWLWEAVMVSNNNNRKDDNLPVEWLSWIDCQKFICELNSLTGKNFCLPTEEEWEFAARGGNSSCGYKYSGGNNIDDVAWYHGNITGDGVRPVGQKRANELGLYDMSGNVREYCYNCWSNDYNSDTDCSRRVHRGGDWYSLAWMCSVSERGYNSSSNNWHGCGFRLVFH